jgi:hypothetical protein
LCKFRDFLKEFLWLGSSHTYLISILRCIFIAHLEFTALCLHPGGQASLQCYFRSVKHSNYFTLNYKRIDFPKSFPDPSMVRFSRAPSLPRALPPPWSTCGKSNKQSIKFYIKTSNKEYFWSFWISILTGQMTKSNRKKKH